MRTDAAAQIEDLPATAWLVTAKKLWQWARVVVKPRKARRLRVCETLSLGEHRFVAVIEFNQQEFLVGGSGDSFELLGQLHEGKVIPEPRLAQRFQLPSDL